MGAPAGKGSSDSNTVMNEAAWTGALSMLKGTDKCGALSRDLPGTGPSVTGSDVDLPSNSSELMNVPSLLRSYADLNVSFQVESGSLAQSHFPDIYREFESLQAQVRRAAHDYIISPQAGSVPLEVRNIEVRAFYPFVLLG